MFLKLCALLLGAAASAAAQVTIASTNYVIIAPDPKIAIERQRHLEWSARLFETLLGVRPPRGRVTLSSAPAGAVVNAAGSSAALVNTFPLTRQPPAPDGTVWNLAWFSRELTSAGLEQGNFSVLTHEAAHLQLIYTVNFHSAANLKARFNGYGSFLPDWLDEGVAVYHEPDTLKVGRRARFNSARRIPFKRFFTMGHPGEAGRAQVVHIDAKSPEEAQRKLAEFQASQQESLRHSAENLARDAVSVEEFYTQALAVIEYLTARGGFPFFRYIVVQQNYGKSMEEILRAWPAKQQEIEALRPEAERLAAKKPPGARPIAKGDLAGPRPPRANTIATVLVRPGEAVNPMPANLAQLETDFAKWVEKNYPRYSPAFPPYPSR